MAIRQSIKAYQDGLAIEPANEQLQAGLQEVEAAKARGGAGGGNPMGALGGIFSSPDVWAKISMNPQTRGYLQQPDFVAMLQAVQANPSSLGQYMQVSCGPTHTALACQLPSYGGCGGVCRRRKVP